MKQGGATFRFDFATVYWNSRLQYEHARISNLICSGPWTAGPASQCTQAADPGEESAEAPSSGEGGPKKRPAGPAAAAPGGMAADEAASEAAEGAELFEGADDAPMPKRRKGGAGKAGQPAGSEQHRLFDPRSGAGIVVADLMAGVGPFAVPLGLRGATVYANDLNPESYKWLAFNAGANKVAYPRLQYYFLYCDVLSQSTTKLTRINRGSNFSRVFIHVGLFG